MSVDPNNPPDRTAPQDGAAPDDVFTRNQNMETDLLALSELRDQMALALTTLEGNTARIQQWLRENRTDIIVARHRLARHTVIAPDAEAALKTITRDIAPDILGFLLETPSVIAEAEAAFGAAHPVVLKLQTQAKGLPAHLVEALPDIQVSEAVARQLRIDDAVPAQNPAPPQKKGVLSSWFKSQAERDAEEAEDTYRGLVGHWRKLQQDLVGLQSDRHYYIDSFMDWVGENLSPSTMQQDFAALLKTYRNPTYMLQCAQQDYNEAQRLRAGALLKDAETYSALARMVDTQDIAGFASALPGIFPAPDTPQAQELRNMLLADFGCRSFAHLALVAVNKPQDRLLLLETALDFEGRPVLASEGNRLAQYKFALEQTLAANHPLPPAALPLVLKRLKLDKGDLATVLADTRSFARLTQRYGTDAAALEDAIAPLIDYMGHHRPLKLAETFAALWQALGRNDARRAVEVLAHMQHINIAADARHLWDLCTDDESFADKIGQVAGTDAAMLSLLIVAAQRTGFVRELSAADIDPAIAYQNLTRMIDGILLPQAAQADARALGAMLAASRIGENAELRQRWYKDLLGTNGRLNVLLAQPLEDRQQQEMLAALLSPLSRREATALLLVAAKAKPEHAKLLTTAAGALTGNALRMNDGSILMNPQAIDNIWYRHGNGGGATVGYYSNGVEHSAERDADLLAADSLITLFTHRHGFATETMGAWQPEKVDIYTFNDKGETTVAWAEGSGKLNIDAAQRAQLQNLPAFIHGDGQASDGSTSRYAIHPRRIVAMIPYGDQWVVLDRGGEHRVLDDVRIPADMPGFVQLGSALVQPRLASILCLDDAAQTVKLRIEHRDFSALLREMQGDAALAPHAPDEDFLHFYAVNDAQWKSLTAEMSASLMLPGTGDFKDFRFNLETLGMVSAYQDGHAVGLQFASQGRYDFRNRVEIEAEALPALFQALLAEAQKRGAVVIHPDDDRTLPAAIHADSILNAFYNPRDKRLEILTPHDSFGFTVSEQQAETLLEKIKALPGFANVQSRARGADLLRLDRVTRVWMDEKDNCVRVLAGNRSIPVGKTASDFDDWSRSLLRAQKDFSPVGLSHFVVEAGHPHDKPAQTVSDSPVALAQKLMQAEKPGQAPPAKKSKDRGYKP